MSLLCFFFQDTVVSIQYLFNIMKINLLARSNRYLASAQYLINGYLDAQGLPKSTQFNVKRPEKSISALINHALKHYLDMNTDVSDYVKPAIDYFKVTSGTYLRMLLFKELI